jgi:hypothetical protein
MILLCVLAFCIHVRAAEDEQYNVEELQAKVELYRKAYAYSRVMVYTGVAFNVVGLGSSIKLLISDESPVGNEENRKYSLLGIVAFAASGASILAGEIFGAISVKKRIDYTKKLQVQLCPNRLSLNLEF